MLSFGTRLGGIKMKISGTLGIAILLIAAFYFGPSVLEAADSPCDALINRVLAIDPPRDENGQPNRIATGMARVLGPVFLKRMVETRYPDVPPQLGCALIYWQSQAEPDSFRRFRPSAEMPEPSRSTSEGSFAASTTALSTLDTVGLEERGQGIGIYAYKVAVAPTTDATAFVPLSDTDAKPSSAEPKSISLPEIKKANNQAAASVPLPRARPQVIPSDAAAPIVLATSTPTTPTASSPAPQGIQAAQSSSPVSLTTDDLPKIVSTYRENEIRFKRDFVGKLFSDVLPFRSATESMFSGGSYRIGFGTGGFTSDVDCRVTSSADISRIVNWNKGEKIHIQGLVKDVTMGSVQLDRCNFSNLSPPRNAEKAPKIELPPDATKPKTIKTIPIQPNGEPK